MMLYFRSWRPTLHREADSTQQRVHVSYKIQVIQSSLHHLPLVQKYLEMLASSKHGASRDMQKISSYGTDTL